MPADTDRQAQLLRGVLDLVVLAVLSREGEAWGYALQGLLHDAGLPDIKGGTLYPLLTRPEKEGLLTATWRPGESGPPRTSFSVTDRGHAVLAEGTTGRLDFSAAVTSVLAMGLETFTTCDSSGACTQTDSETRLLGVDLGEAVAMTPFVLVPVASLVLVAVGLRRR